MRSQLFTFLCLLAFTITNVFANYVENFCSGFTPEDWVDEFIEATFVLTVSNIQYTGSCEAAGHVIYDDNINYVGYTLGIGETALVLTSGNLSTAASSVNEFDGKTGDNGEPGDPDLEALVNNGSLYGSYDASIIEFDIESTVAVTATFEYVFASEEYNEYVDSEFNDVFAFWLDDTNVALIGSTVVAINNVNNGDLSEYYVDNDIFDSLTETVEPKLSGDEGFPTEYDGLTVLLTTSPYDIPANEVVHVKLAISDIGDEVLDSAAFLKPQSFHLVGTIDNETRTFVIPDSTLPPGTTDGGEGGGGGTNTGSPTGTGSNENTGTDEMSTTGGDGTITIEITLEGRFDFDEDSVAAERIDIAEVFMSHFFVAICDFFAIVLINHKQQKQNNKNKYKKRFCKKVDQSIQSNHSISHHTTGPCMFCSENSTSRCLICLFFGFVSSHNRIGYYNISNREHIGK